MKLIPPLPKFKNQKRKKKVTAPSSSNWTAHPLGAVQGMIPRGLTLHVLFYICPLNPNSKTQQMQEVTLRNAMWVCDFPGGHGPASSDRIEISAERGDRLSPHEFCL